MQHEEEQIKIETLCQELIAQCLYLLRTHVKQGRPVTVAEANVHIFVIERKFRQAQELLKQFYKLTMDTYIMQAEAMAVQLPSTHVGLS